jgi:hypothetical protein
MVLDLRLTMKIVVVVRQPFFFRDLGNWNTMEYTKNPFVSDKLCDKILFVKKYVKIYFATKKILSLHPKKENIKN